MGNKPDKKLQSGQISATIWKKQIEVKNNEVDVYSVEIVKNYKNEKGEWNKTSSFNKNELINVKVVLDEAIKELFLKNELELKRA